MSCPHGEYVQGELRPYQGRSRGDRRQGTRPPTQRPRTEQTAAAGARSIKSVVQSDDAYGKTQYLFYLTENKTVIFFANNG